MWKLPWSYPCSTRGRKWPPFWPYWWGVSYTSGATEGCIEWYKAQLHAHRALFRYPRRRGVHLLPRSLIRVGAELNGLLTQGPSARKPKERRHGVFYCPKGGLLNTVARGDSPGLPHSRRAPCRGRANNQDRAAAATLLGPGRGSPPPREGALSVAQVAEISPTNHYLVHDGAAASVSSGERRGRRDAHNRSVLRASSPRFQGHGPNGVAPVVPSRVRPLLSRSLLYYPGPHSGLIIFPEPELWLGFAKCGGPPPPHGVCYQAQGTPSPPRPAGRVPFGGEWGRPVLLLPLPRQRAV